ncbi:MAG: sugar phosphate isomerase/epimerase [Succinivibrio sp.]|nr:sugar phosphate isomerase/epimerase [Succinivibrio sp.]
MAFNTKQLSISNIAWDVKDDFKVAEILNKHEVKYIDLAPSKYFKDFKDATIPEIEQVKDTWKNRGISIYGMQSLMFGTKDLNLFGNTLVQSVMLDHLSSVCRIGELLDARYLVFGSPKNRDCSVVEDDKREDIALNFFYRLGEIAKHYNVTICLEPNPELYGANFLTTTQDTYDFVSKLNHPNIRIQLDTGTMLVNNEVASVIEHVKYMIGHVHLSQKHLTVLGDSCEDIPNTAISTIDNVSNNILSSKFSCIEEAHKCLAKALNQIETKIYTIEMLTNKDDEPLKAIDRAISFASKVYLKQY